MEEQVRKLFEKIRSQPEVDSINQIEAVLPADPGAISALGTMCQSESRKALRAGRHMDRRRLGILGEQFYRRALGKRV